jgi:acyl carrier protein
VLATHPQVRQCVVAVREDTPGDQRLIGYVVCAPGPTFDHDAARKTLRDRVPEYMVPNQFVVLPALPLTPNGKIDRKALPAPATPTATLPTSADDLMTPAQRRVAAAWREVLRTDRVGLDDNFFDLGGHSLLLVRLQAALRSAFGVDIALVELFQRTTVAAQAERFSAPVARPGVLQRAQSRAGRQVNA